MGYLPEGAKKVSIIIHCRIQQQILDIGSNSQFGQMQDAKKQEAQNTLKWALLICRQHGIDSFIVFVDVVKVYDTANHQLMYDILAK